MSIRVSIENEQVNVKSGTNSRGPWQIREQEAWAYLSNRDGSAHKHPSRIVISLEAEQAPYPVGDYTVSPTSFYVGQYGSLMFRARLQLLKQPVRAAA